MAEVLGKINRKVWLAAQFRVGLISEGIEKAEGINRLARILGYKSRIHPAWPLRQIIVGKQPFPFERLARLADFMHHDLAEILHHEVLSARLANENNEVALMRYGFASYSNMAIPR